MARSIQMERAYIMADQYYPLGHFRVVGLIKMWDQFYWPVYECDELATKAQVEAAMNKNINFYYGEQGESAPVTLLQGQIAIDMDEALTHRGDTTNSTTTQNYTYHQNNYTATRTVRVTYYSLRNRTHSEVTWSANNDRYIIWTFVDSDDSGTNWGTILNEEQTTGYMRCKDTNGIYYYFRAHILIYIELSGDYSSRYPVLVNLYYGSNTTFANSFLGIRNGEIKTIDNFNAGNPVEVPLPDVPVGPFEPIDPSGPTNPNSPPGTFDDNSDAIPDSSLPSLSSANTGFTRIYNPTLAQVQSLASYLWTDTTVIETIWNHIKQYFEDPMQAIIGFNLVPVPVPDGGTQEFKLMYIPTGVQMTVAASQFVDVDCGTLHLDPYYGSALDYAPNTKISCFLPYIGNVELNPDEIMNTTLQVKYRVDICSGSCVAKILVDGNVLYQYSGHCAINIPLSSADFSSYVSAAISVAKLGVGVAAAGALGAAGLEAAAVTQATSAAETVVRDSEGVVDWSKTTTRQSTRTSSPSPASYTGITPKNISNTVGQIMGAKPTFQHSGSFSGNTGYLGVRRPYLIITRPNLCLPSSYQAMNGFPSMITMLLSECQGFTQVQQLHFQGSSATNPEVDEILQLLKSGVVF